jgi:hypothetical protein
MIHYDLICDQGHAFDGWFRDSAAYDAQAAQGLVSCSACGSTDVQKQIMAPGIPVRSNRRGDTPQKVMAGPVDPRLQMMMQMVREMRRHVEENAEYVGDRFAEEARKIHFAEAPERGIYGEATPEDARTLVEEGISVFPLPRLPEDGN